MTLLAQNEFSCNATHTRVSEVTHQLPDRAGRNLGADIYKENDFRGRRSYARIHCGGFSAVFVENDRPDRRRLKARQQFDGSVS